MEDADWIADCTFVARREGMRARVIAQPVARMLECGNCEPLKATVHGGVAALAALCAAYNTAAWLKRRQRHLAVNALLYATTVWWERCQVAHHRAACARDARNDEPASPQLSDTA